jgi:hypothetical protein
MNLRDVTVSTVKEAREDGEYVSEVKLNGERIGWVRQLGKHPHVTGFEAYTVRQQIIEGTPRNQREAVQIVKREYLRIKARDESIDRDMAREVEAEQPATDIFDEPSEPDSYASIEVTDDDEVEAEAESTDDAASDTEDER